MHTKEPWYILGNKNNAVWIAADNRKVANVSNTASYLSNEDEANAKRIVACVNACEYFLDPELAIKEIVNGGIRFKQQRDKLLELFKKTIQASEGYISRNILIEINELIAEVEGKND